MSTPSRTESPVFRFLDNFLQEKNIKWVLTTGMLILLGSSLMTIMPHWNTFDPIGKFLTIVGYTGAIFAAGWWSYQKLGLPRTGTALLALTVLMIPVSFLAWHWFWNSTDGLAESGFAVALLGLQVVAAFVTSRCIFHHFLRGSQPTFVACYLVMSFAAAVSPGFRHAGAVWSWLASIVLWGVFSIGVVKVNRRVFWLTEEHRQPRVFGFFPILLLGGQFFSLFAANFAWALPAEWLGFGLVLVAIPVLLTADAVAKVFQERTGDLVRPLPWPIMLPFLVGLILCGAGVVVAGSTVLQRTPFAIVPTAAVAASLMALTARRTHRVAFVWAMLAGIVLAYNFSPVFFQSVARAAIAQGAAAVREPRLPFAFYGLTYLPLILVASAFATFARRRGNLLFATPLQYFCVGISWILLAASLGHVKALFPVGLVMLGVFAFQAILFQDRRLALPAILAFLIASTGAAPFLGPWLDMPLAANATFYVPLGVTVGLLVASPWLDRQIRKLPFEPFDPQSRAAQLWTSMSRMVSLYASVLLAAVWMMRFVFPGLESAPTLSLLVVVLLCLQSVIWVRPILSGFTYAVAVIELVRFASGLGATTENILWCSTPLFLAQWALTYLFARFPTHRVGRAWAGVNEITATSGLLVSTLFIALPDVVRGTLGEGGTVLGLLRDLLLAAWCFLATYRLREVSTSLRERSFAQSFLVALGSLVVMGSVSSAMVQWPGNEAQDWIPVAWTATALAALVPMVAWRRRLNSMAQEVVLAEDYHALHAICTPIETIQYFVFGLFAAWHLVEFSVPMRAAGYLAMAGLLRLSYARPRPMQQQLTLAAVNWVIVWSSVQWLVPQASNLFDLSHAELGLAPWCVAAISAASLAFWLRQEDSISGAVSEIRLAQRIGLRMVSIGSLLFTLRLEELEPLAVILTGCTLASFIAVELRAACRGNDTTRAWNAELLLGMACGYYLWFGVISFGRGWSMFVVLAGGVAFHLLGVLAARRPTTAILAKPFGTTGLWMPLATVGLGVFRHLTLGDSIVWHGMNSFAILLAGGFYFWQAMEQHSKRFAILSAGILNIALALLWRELEFSDPQFYLIPVGISILALVQILKREIPRGWSDPLRYAGALAILVSPTFHIVSGSWLHLFTLMIASTAVLLVAIGLRIRALMYTGVGFLIADLIGMVVCGGVDHPDLLWAAGIGLGAAIIGLGAVCEHHREKLLQRMRIVSAQLRQWE